jgi:phenylpyruvate tautomerase
MPFLKLETNVSMSDEKRDFLLAGLSRRVAMSIGKPEEYVMASISSAALFMAGKPGAAAFVDIRSIGGLSGLVNEKLSQEICAVLKEGLGIAPERVYMNFANVEASYWGWNNETFG